MTDRHARDLTIPLDLFSSSTEAPFKAEIYRDDESATYHLAHETRDVTANEKMQIHLAAAGGFLVRLMPAKPK